jgi:RNA polymerase sigma factor (sigma-70 family)
MQDSGTRTASYDDNVMSYYRRLIEGKQASDDELRSFLVLLWENYSNEVFVYARAKMQDDDAAMDICQGTFLRAWRWLVSTRGHCEKKVHFPAWLRRIAWHLIVDYRRKPKDIPISSIDKKENDDSFIEDCQDLSFPSPYETITRDEQIAWLKECLDKAQEQHRQILIFCDVEGKLQKDVALMLGMSPATLNRHLELARRELQKCVEYKSRGCLGEVLI